MRCIAVDAIRATRCDDLDRRLVHARISHLHRARVRAQQQRLAFAIMAFDVKRVLHRARRMVFRAVQGSKVGPVRLDLGAVSDVEANRGKDFLDALPGAHDGMDAAHAVAAARQGDIDCFGIQALQHLCIRQRITARMQRGFDLLFGGIDDGALHFALIRREFAETLHLFSDLARLAEITRFRVF